MLAAVTLLGVSFAQVVKWYLVGGWAWGGVGGKGKGGGGEDLQSAEEKHKEQRNLGLLWDIQVPEDIPR